MAPYYESGRRLSVGDRVNFGVGSKKAELEVWGDNLAIVTTSANRDVYVGKANKKTGELSSVSIIAGRAVIDQESVSTNKRRPEIVWRNK